MGYSSRTRWLLLAPLLAALCAGCIVLTQAPTLSPSKGFTLLVQKGSQPPTALAISKDGAGCETFHDSVANVCFIATSAVPSVIGGAAHGALNDADTPALAALIWRARIDGDVSVCERGGLIGERRTRCEQAAQDPNYSVTDGERTVTVPLAQ